MPYTKSDSERGPIYSANGAMLHVPVDRVAFAPLIPALEEFNERATEAESVMKPEALPPHLTRIAEPLFKAANRVLAAATNNAREVEGLKARALTPPPAIADAAKLYGSEVRGIVRTMTTADQATFVQRASAVELAALLEQGGNLVALDTQILDVAHARAISVFHIERSALSAAHPAQPSLDRIIALGIDRTATNAAAEIAIASYKARVEAVELDEAVAAHLVGYLASATATTPSQALASVMAAA